MNDVARSPILFLLLALAGCDATDPYLRARRLAADRRQRGQSARHGGGAVRSRWWRRPPRRADGGLAAAAVARLRHDRVRPLLDSGIAQIVPVAGGRRGATGGGAVAGGSGN